MERYTSLYRLPENQYTAGSPVLLEAGAAEGQPDGRGAGAAKNAERFGKADPCSHGCGGCF